MISTIPPPLRSAFDALLHDAAGPLVIAHRGTSLGSFPDNTLRSAVGALRSGADVIEVDVVRSADGVYYLFHDGYEQHAFGQRFDIRSLTSEAIDELNYLRGGGSGTGAVERLDTLLETLPDAWLNIDRSWAWWPDLLDTLERSGVGEHILLKSPPEARALRELAEHPAPFLYYPIVRTPAELAEIEAIPGVHLIGAELLARTTADPFADPAAVAAVADRLPLVQLNALNLENGIPLYLGYDDDTSILRGPAHGWGRLLEAGATAIQTDWPHLLRRHLAEQGLRAAP